MKCDECQMLFAADVDGESTGEFQVQLSQHLDSCAECRSFVTQLRSETEVYASYESPVKVQPDLWAKVQSRLDELPTEQSNRNTLPSWLATRVTLPRVSVWATAVLVLLAIGLTVAVMKYAGFRNPVTPTANPHSATAGQSTSNEPRKLNNSP